MKKLACALSLLSLAALNACTAIAPGAKPALSSQPVSPLFATVAALDAAVFDAFNGCSAPGELQRYANYFSPDVEFYHDEGGVTWKRSEMIANTKKNVCGKYRREPVPGTLKVFPVKNFGAIAQGEHRFCQLASGKCDGMADFVMVWRKRGNVWQITRVLSFAHRPIE